MMETVDHGIMQSNLNKAFLARGFFEVILTDGGSEFTDREAMKRERLEITARRFIIVIRMLSGRKDAA